MNVKIRVYYHVTCINHFLEITEYIFDRIVSSGLYEYIEGIYIGALGEPEELIKLEELIKKYPKAIIRSHSERKADYEFHTLRLLHEDSKTLPKFYGMYLHSKSVTFPKEGCEGRTPNDHKYDWYWMQYMVYWMVEQWQKCYRALDMKDIGYDICGVKIAPARMSASKRTHASGNMWFANSEYIKTLDSKTIEWSEWKDIFEGEMWAFSGNPIIYMPCNMFTDGFPFQIPFYEYMEKIKNIEDYTI